MAGESMYWSPGRLLSKNAMFNFAIGGRGTGKTYAFKKFAISAFIKKGAESIYLRRYESELDDRASFFNDIAPKFPGFEFQVHGHQGQIRRVAEEGEKPEKWRTFLYFVALSRALTKKSVPYPKVKIICYDEFIIDKGHIRYLGQEVKSLLDFYVTVDRYQDRVRILFIANAVRFANPYFIYFNLNPRRGDGIITAADGYCAVELIEGEAFRRHAESTRFGRMISGSAYAEYSIGNAFEDLKSPFLKKKPSDARFLFGLGVDGERLGFWMTPNINEGFLSKRIPKDGTVYALTARDRTPNMQAIDRAAPPLKIIKRLYMEGRLYYESSAVEEAFQTVKMIVGLNR